ncbi:response regulator [Burkholderia seminalis]|uniref:response regulator n=1 Tax=Burkholderia seminalis TaxID=488731 RepID=UPI001908E250|nr:response regulator [Burkholderia seminalis]MBJ9965619.1 response regulator [Burkholderia seminalis]MDN7586832.1 response regulator [Burkholderia seminalis]
MSTRLLIADDHPIVLAGIRDALAKERDLQIVGEARDPAALIELMARVQPDALITDYSMPGNEEFSDGIKLISYLHRRFPECHLLVLTMMSNPSLLSAMYAAGAAGVVVKSHGLASLVQALRTILSGRLHHAPELQTDALCRDAESGVEAAASLSPREFEVIRLFVRGLSVRDIALQLNRSGKTVSTQKVSAMRKLGVDTDQALIEYCLRVALFG